MLTKVRSKLTYPYIASTLALFLALTGGAFALEGRNSVDSGDIKPQAVRSGDIKNGNGVKTVDVKDDGLTGTDVLESSLGQVPSAANADNATSANSANSANTANSAATATKLANVTVQREDFNVNDASFNAVTVECPAGQQILGGGVRDHTSTSDGAVQVFRPVVTGTGDPNDGEGFNGWRVGVNNPTGGTGTFSSTAWAICAG